MSRVGKQPILVSDKVHATLKDGVLEAKGPLGVLRVPCNPRTTVELEGDTIRVHPKTSGDSPFQGLMRSLISNALEGVSKGYEKRLEIVGVGYRAEVQDGALKLQVGFSHPVLVPAPETIQFVVGAVGSVGGVPVTPVTVKGIDKELVGRVAARVRLVKPPEPYKGKGIRYSDEIVRRKAGKAAGV